MTLYNWMLWLHILFAFLFFFVHGVSMATAFLLPKEKDLKRMSMLLDLPNITIVPMAVSMLGLLVTSIYMGGAAQWWGRGWWGASFLIFLAMIYWMGSYSRRYYSPIRKAMGTFYMTGFATRNEPIENHEVDSAEVERLIAKTNPHLLMTVGFVGLGALLFLMRFKPF
jgi:hypothetical protein